MHTYQQQKRVNIQFLLNYSKITEHKCSIQFLKKLLIKIKHDMTIWFDSFWTKVIKETKPNQTKPI